MRRPKGRRPGGSCQPEQLSRALEWSSAPETKPHITDVIVNGLLREMAAPETQSADRAAGSDCQARPRSRRSDLLKQ
jgi:hypothetical protein